MSDSLAESIISGRTYNKPDKPYPYRTKLTEQEVKEILGQLKLGRTMEWLAVKYKVSYWTIQSIKNKKSWKNISVGQTQNIQSSTNQ